MFHFDTRKNIVCPAIVFAEVYSYVIVYRVPHTTYYIYTHIITYYYTDTSQLVTTNRRGSTTTTNESSKIIANIKTINPSFV